LTVKAYRNRLHIWETNYGRDAGWIIERRGAPVAILTDVQFQVMFWDTYKIEIVTHDLALRERIGSREFWDNAEAEGLLYRNRKFEYVAEIAFPALTPFTQDGRLIMRGLYLRIGAPRVWDKVVLWARRRAKRSRHLAAGHTP
jgi:hypothetical protein